MHLWRVSKSHHFVYHAAPLELAKVFRALAQPRSAQSSNAELMNLDFSARVSAYSYSLPNGPDVSQFHQPQHVYHRQIRNDGALHMLYLRSNTSCILWPTAFALARSCLHDRVIICGLRVATSNASLQSGLSKYPRPAYLPEIRSQPIT